MGMQADLLALLRAHGGLTAKVVDRINWMVRPKGKGLSAITLQLIDGIPDYVTTGRSDLTESRVQADIWAKTYTDLTEARDQLVAAVTATDATDGSGCISNISILSERDLTDTSQPDLIFRRSIDLLVHDNQA